MENLHELPPPPLPFTEQKTNEKDENDDIIERVKKQRERNKIKCSEYYRRNKQKLKEYKELTNKSITIMLHDAMLTEPTKININTLKESAEIIDKLLAALQDNRLILNYSVEFG